MRKILFVILLGLLAAGAAEAEELTIRLQSGNAIVVRYEGVIEGIELQGESDAIAGLEMPAAPAAPLENRQEVVSRLESPAQPGKKKADDQEGSWLQLRWADPIDEAK